MANRETPDDVEIPSTWGGIAAWLIGKFGIGIVTIGLLAYAAYIVYRDDHQLVDRVMSAFEQRSKVDAAQAAANSAIADSIRQMTIEIREAHIRASGK